jgi:hypothetical protein
MAQSGRNGLRVLIGLVAVGAFFAAAALAASRRGPAAGPEARAQAGRAARPAIVDHPDSRSPSTSARFDFTVRTPPGARFQCRLDRMRWQACKPPVFFAGLAVGGHWFSVRALDRQRRHGAARGFRWTVLESKEFSIVPELSGLAPLYPGAPPVALPLTVRNPNSEPIRVTALRVSVRADPPGCASADNLALGQSNASGSLPLKVSAGGSVRLPTQGVLPPTIQLRDLPVNQDACKNARFPLEFTGSARG